MTEPTPETPPAPATDSKPTPLGLVAAARLQPWLAVGIAVVLLAVGYAIGTVRAGVSEHTGTAYADETHIGVTADGWTYDVPLDVTWLDGAGTIHFGERPACLPARPVTTRLHFAEVEVTLAGTTFRQVVWVTCSATP